MIWDFTVHRSLPVRDHFDSIKDGLSLLNQVSKNLESPCMTEIDRRKVCCQSQYVRSNFATKGFAKLLTFNLILKDRLRLLRTSTSQPSWFFEALFSVPKVVVDVQVFVHGLHGWRASFSNTKQESQPDSQDGNKEFGNPGRRGRRRPTEACSNVLKPLTSWDTLIIRV